MTARKLTCLRLEMVPAACGGPLGVDGTLAEGLLDTTEVGWATHHACLVPGMPGVLVHGGRLLAWNRLEGKVKRY